VGRIAAMRQNLSPAAAGPSKTLGFPLLGLGALLAYVKVMSNTRDARLERRELMAVRSKMLAAGDIEGYQRLNKMIADLPMDGVKPLTDEDIKKYAGRRQR
jgi:hypothetical protein